MQNGGKRRLGCLHVDLRPAAHDGASLDLIKKDDGSEFLETASNIYRPSQKILGADDVRTRRQGGNDYKISDDDPPSSITTIS